MRARPRRSLPLLALALVALAGVACSEPATPGTGKTGGDGERDAGPTEPEVLLELIDVRGKTRRQFDASSPIRLRLTLRNPTERDLVLTFSSGRTHDAVVTGADGREYWRWSKGRMFSQALGELRLGPSGESSFELVCDPSAIPGSDGLAPGHYRATALIPALGDELRSAEIAFQIEEQVE